MTRAPSMWETILARAAQALDWTVCAIERDTIAVSDPRPQFNPQVALAAHALVEVDKKVRYGIGPAIPEFETATAARERLDYIVLQDALEYDAVLAAKAAYRTALARAAWALVADRPDKLLRDLAGVYED